MTNAPGSEILKPSKRFQKAYEAAKKAGKGAEPVLHYHGPHGPHFHPDVPMPKGALKPHQPSPHDHYFFPK